ncbi:WhiB family transcriptional regulator [Pseudonocardia sp. KRD-184]|uniref:Transcriptional regulator WhiB n=1 Tax=Pseudonocardia oceani TaxID=2792013 RepID=A0ABS6UGX4_9PSEU|nr:WhiB family transcriptional regulator [Pseudonocardia oceani]MBW0088792.1 WhiB family transcriptional regulator [Pseudonocardia oceani]MBW0096391.1 WhiB family transcriptional regulator [Pseudonocardia oceani]MBW0107362.1 WhiB family transcriptional regulator [Pseudonocardia oceani]MBW0122459.1 WhiB family transcriptional regulator [Pseudonocardia oceani]MBW0131494.1 WhiB family transcriptional regulator [Pseudonocardia oceani]
MTNWLDRAACRDVDPETFFPTGAGRLTERQETRAKSVCRRCPVRSECLHSAQLHASDDGVWGGLDAGERRALRRTRAPRAEQGAA